MAYICQTSHVRKSPGNKNQSSTRKLSSNKISCPEFKNHTSDEKKGKKLIHTVRMLVENWKVCNSKSDCFVWILLCSFCCSRIVHFLHVLLCCLIEEGTLLEYTVNQQGFTFGETIDEGSLLERWLIRGDFWRDYWQKKALSERQLTRGNFQRDNQLTRGAISDRKPFDEGNTFGETQKYRYKFLNSIVAAC